MKVTQSNPILATALRFSPGGELAVGRNGELNASSKSDLLFQQQRFLQASASGQLMTEGQAEVLEARKQLVTAAMEDVGQARVLGERYTDALYEVCNRQGFARKFYAKVNPVQGSPIRVKMYRKNTAAVVATGPTQVKPQIVNDPYYTPPELQLITRPYITQNDLNQSPGDVLGEKFVESQEAIMVGEDRLWKRAADAASGMVQGNGLTIINGQLTPYSLARLRTQVTRWGLNAPHLLIASNIYEDIIGNTEFHSGLDPIAKHELILTGALAYLYGMTITSDAYRHEQHRVLNGGELYVIADPVNHGAYADRDSLISAPIGIETEGVAGRGWVISESWSSVTTNARSVARGIRV